MKIGILGCGQIAAKMSITLQQLKDAECYAVASRDINKARDFANKYGYMKAYGSYVELLNDPNVELVYIATPHSHHYEHVKMSLNHGKHVLCEKAFCANAKQAEEVLLMAEDYGLLLTEAMWTRYMPMRNIIDKVVKSGIIGAPTSLAANLGYPLQHIERLVRPELAGGALLDLGVYVLNFALMVFGNKISSVAANCIKLDTGVDAQENIMLTYSDGKMASLYSTILAQTDRRGFINGTNGYIEIENINNYEMLKVYNLDRKVVSEYAAPTQITGYEYEVNAAIRAIKEGRIETDEMPHSETLIVMQLMDSIRMAWGVEYPFEKDDYVGNYKQFVGYSGKDEKKSVVKKISERSVNDSSNAKKINEKNAHKEKNEKDKTKTVGENKILKESVKLKNNKPTDTGVKATDVKRNVTEKSVTEKSVTEKSVTEKSVTEKSVTEKMAANGSGKALDDIKKNVGKYEKRVKDIEDSIKDLSIEEDDDFVIEDTSFQRRRSKPLMGIRKKNE